MVNLLLMDSTNLPLRDKSIDSAVTDLPFGKRIKEAMLGVNNRLILCFAIDLEFRYS